MAVIPVANKHEDTAVNQHLVPQCYMREWGYNPKKSSVWVYEKDCSVVETDIEEINHIYGSKPIKKINAIDNYYDIKAGCYFMPQEALDEIFGPTMHLIVKFEEQVLDTEKKRNDKFKLFDEWIITDDLGVELTETERLALKQYFSDARYVFIEKEWDRQYENNWRDYIKNLEEKIRKTKAGIDCKVIDGKTVSSIITGDIISEIVKLLIVFDIRGFSTDNYLNKKIDEVWNVLPKEFAEMELEPEDRMHPIETTVKEWFRHEYILHICYDILKDKHITGVAKTIWDAYKTHLVPRFCLTDMSYPFVTSERPAFINILETGEQEQIFVALPTMLICMGRGNPGQFFINNLSKDEVDYYNKVVVQNNELIISCTDKFNIEKCFD